MDGPGNPRSQLHSRTRCVTTEKTKRRRLELPYIDSQRVPVLKNAVKVNHQTGCAVRAEEMIFLHRIELVFPDTGQGISVPLDLVAPWIDKQVAIASANGAIAI